MVRLAETDELVSDTLSMMGAPRPVPMLVKGETHEIELAEVLDELAELAARAAKDGWTDKQEDVERRRLRARRDELEGLPSTPDHMEMVTLCGTCDGSVYGHGCKAAQHHEITIGEHFRTLDEAGRRAMMLSDGIKVYASGNKFMPVEIEFSAPELAPQAVSETV